MPTVLEWNPTVTREDLRRAIETAEQAGVPVVLPGDCGYAVALPIRSPQLADLVERLGVPPAWWVANGEPLQRRGWGVPIALERLFRRDWPLPLVALLPVEQLLPCGNDSWLTWVVDERNRLRLRHPDHPIAVEIAETIDPSAWLLVDSYQETAEGALDLLDQAEAFAVAAGRLPVESRPSQVLFGSEGWEMVSAGAVSAEELAPLLARVIVFLCTGNTCRSPLAAGIAQKLAAERLGCRVEELVQRGVWITSAGLGTSGGWPASAEAVQVAAELGVDLREHRSRRLQPWLLAIADEVITMTQEHCQMLLVQYPGLGPPPRLICEGVDVPDPIGAGLDAYRACAAVLRQLVERNIAEWLSP
jgi:protein-tyrosine phosphatase